MLKRDTGWISLAAILVISVVVLASCGGSSSASDDEVVVFAAASLTESFNELKTAYEEEHPHRTVTYNFAGSQQLATQLTQGADADVYASANAVQMEIVKEAGVVTTEPVIFAHNRLVIIVPDENPANLQAPADLANPGTKLVLANPDVPAGRYARESLDKMNDDPAVGDDFRERVEANIVSNESNVKQVVTKVQLGEADAGIVYRTDVTPEVAAEVEMIEIPAKLNVVADYLIDVVDDGDTDAGRDFIRFVQSTEGQRILTDYGFEPGNP